MLREYPDGPVTAHVVGFTGWDDHGQEGVELSKDDVLTGKGGGWLNPAGTATRAEMAAILMRFTESHN